MPLFLSIITTITIGITDHNLVPKLFTKIGLHTTAQTFRPLPGHLASYENSPYNHTMHTSLKFHCNFQMCEGNLILHVFVSAPALFSSLTFYPYIKLSLSKSKHFKTWILVSPKISPIKYFFTAVKITCRECRVCPTPLANAPWRRGIPRWWEDISYFIISP